MRQAGISVVLLGVVAAVIVGLSHPSVSPSLSLPLSLSPAFVNAFNFNVKDMIDEQSRAWIDRTFSSGMLRPSRDSVLEWVMDGQEPLDWSLPRSQIFTSLRSRFFRRVEESVRTILGGGDPSRYQHTKYDFNDESNDKKPYYFGWIPDSIGGVVPKGQPLTWNRVSGASCFKKNSASLSHVGDRTYTLSVTVDQPSTPGCSDFYLFATIDGLQLHTFSAPGTTDLTWTAPSDQSEGDAWDLANRGIRVFQFRGNMIEMLGAVLDTVLLFSAEASPTVSDEAAAMNRDFLRRYAGFEYEPRNASIVDLDPTMLKSGDYLAIMRFDGLDPMLAWAMGSTTGHAASLLWVDGELYVVESTVKSAFWPADGIQRTPYQTWVKRLQDIGSIAVLAPLTAEARARFNETAAVEWFKQQEGLEYGYHTLLWGWLDTINDNYPCLPPAFDQCLSWDMMESVFGWMDRWAPFLGELLFNEAFNLRLGSEGLKAPELFMRAAQMGYQHGELPTIPEQDVWLYNTTKHGEVTRGPSRVCCVFSCDLWKAAGVFGELADEIQCGELTNWDDYSLNLLDVPQQRPAQCVAADPTNALCQLEGSYQLHLNEYATKAPYPHLAEKCPTLAPEYKKPNDC